MKRVPIFFLALSFVVWSSARANATTITFEGFAPSGGLVNVNPGAPYTESGYTLTPSTPESAVFDSAAFVDMPGDTTDFFGFAESNIITLTSASGAFDLTSLLLGPITVGGGTTSVTILGQLAGGGVLTSTFSDLTTATLASLNWTNLSSVQFRVTDDSGLDDIVTSTAVPEPASCLLLGSGLATLLARRRRHGRV